MCVMLYIPMMYLFYNWNLHLLPTPRAQNLHPFTTFTPMLLTTSVITNLFSDLCI